MDGAAAFGSPCVCSRGPGSTKASNKPHSYTQTGTQASKDSASWHLFGSSKDVKSTCELIKFDSD